MSDTSVVDGFEQPQNVTDLQMAFSANLGGLIPDWETVPENFRQHYGDSESKPWIDFQSDWFFSGVAKASVKPREGVDMDAALRHLSTIQGSFEPKHEHKQAAVAWLASRWFESYKRVTK